MCNCYRSQRGCRQRIASNLVRFGGAYLVDKPVKLNISHRSNFIQYYDMRACVIPQHYLMRHPADSEQQASLQEHEPVLVTSYDGLHYKSCPLSTRPGP
jgi:hypothetical protein